MRREKRKTMTRDLVKANKVEVRHLVTLIEILITQMIILHNMTNKSSRQQKWVKIETMQNWNLISCLTLKNRRIMRISLNQRKILNK